MADKNNSDVDIGREPSKFWYGFIGSQLIVPLICWYTKIKVKPDQDYLKEEGPIVVLGNHPSYLDPVVVERLTHGRPTNFVAGEFVFRKKGWGYWFKLGGAIPKKQFVVDTVAVKAMMRVLKRKGSLCIFPEATRFIDGTSKSFDDGVARMIKKTNSAIYIARSNGAYLTWPRWSESGMRMGKITASFVRKLPGEKVKDMSIEEIQEYIMDGMAYNEYDYSRASNPTHRNSKMASGIQNVGFICPKCKKQFTMDFVGGSTVKCSDCGNEINVLGNGLFEAGNDESKTFEDLHEWVKWEKDIIAEELKNPDFKMELDCRLVKEIGISSFAHTGNGKITVTADEILYEGSDCEVEYGIPCHHGKDKRVSKSKMDLFEKNSKNISRTYGIKSMKGLAAKYGQYIEIYDKDGELYRFYTEGKKVFKIQQVVMLFKKMDFEG